MQSKLSSWENRSIIQRWKTIQTKMKHGTLLTATTVEAAMLLRRINAPLSDSSVMCAKCCKSKQWTYNRQQPRRTVHWLEPDQADNTTDETFYVDSLLLQMSFDSTDAEIEENNEASNYKLQINNASVEMKVDTGAKCNVVPQKTFEQIKDKEQTVCTKPTNLVAYGGIWRNRDSQHC